MPIAHHVEGVCEVLVSTPIQHLEMARPGPPDFGQLKATFKLCAALTVPKMKIDNCIALLRFKNGTGLLIYVFAAQKINI